MREKYCIFLRVSLVIISFALDLLTCDGKENLKQQEQENLQQQEQENLKQQKQEENFSFCEFFEKLDDGSGKCQDKNCHKGIKCNQGFLNNLMFDNFMRMSYRQLHSWVTR